MRINWGGSSKLMKQKVSLKNENKKKIRRKINGKFNDIISADENK
jgi:hypothetical protein